MKIFGCHKKKKKLINKNHKVKTSEQLYAKTEKLRIWIQVQERNPAKRVERLQENPGGSTAREEATLQEKELDEEGKS